MIASCCIVLLAFLWLLYETRWLTVRLPYGEAVGDTLILDSLPIIVAASVVIMIVGKVFGIKPKARATRGQRVVTFVKRLLAVVKRKVGYKEKVKV